MAHDDAPKRSRSTSPTASSAPDLSILGDQVSLHPTGYTRTTSQDALAVGATQAAPEQNLVEGMARFRQSPLDFLRELSSHISGSGWRSYDNAIGQPVFYSGFSEQMKARVVGNPMLKAKIRELAAKRVDVEDVEEGRFGTGEAQGRGAEGEKGGRLQKKERRRRELETQLEEVVESMTDAMICKMESKRFIRGAYYFCTQLLTRAYHQDGWMSFPRTREASESHAHNARFSSHNEMFCHTFYVATRNYSNDSFSDTMLILI